MGLAALILGLCSKLATSVRTSLLSESLPLRTVGSSLKMTFSGLFVFKNLLVISMFIVGISLPVIDARTPLFEASLSICDIRLEIRCKFYSCFFLALLPLGCITWSMPALFLLLFRVSRGEPLFYLSYGYRRYSGKVAFGV